MSKANTYFGTSIGVAVFIAVIIMIINSSVGSALKGDTSADMSEEAIAERIAPVGKLNTGEAIVPETAAAEPATAESAAAEPAADTAASAGRPAKEIYDASCFACHGTGAAGAPMLGDAAAWAPRIDKGMDTLMNHAINGFNAMPPRGTCTSCSDEELMSVVEYMLENSK